MGPLHKMQAAKQEEGGDRAKQGGGGLGVDGQVEGSSFPLRQVQVCGLQTSQPDQPQENQARGHHVHG